MRAWRKQRNAAPGVQHTPLAETSPVNTAPACKFEAFHGSFSIDDTIIVSPLNGSTIIALLY
jgi:hypothetical protein